MPTSRVGPPIYIFGASHSGTTILHRMLAMHPDLTWYSQFSLRAGQIPGRRRVRGARVADVVLRWRPHDWHKGESPRTPRARPGESPTVWTYLLKEKGDDPAVLRGVVDDFAERRGKRLVAKLPWFFKYWDVLHAAHPEAVFVHAVRDGRAVAFSNFSRRESTPDLIEREAQYWLDVVDAATAASRVAQVVTVRYEDLCADVHGQLTTLLQALDLDTTRFPYDRVPPSLHTTNDRWLAAADASDIAAITERQAAALAALGYPRVLA